MGEKKGSLKIKNTSPKLSNNTAKNQRKKGRLKSQISVSQTSYQQDGKMILLNDFEYRKDSAIVIEETTLQVVRTDITR